MRPEKVQKRDNEAAYTTINIPAEWVAPIQKARIPHRSRRSRSQSEQKHQEICGINKKYKLELANPTIDDVKEWVENAKR